MELTMTARGRKALAAAKTVLVLLVLAATFGWLLVAYTHGEARRCDYLRQTGSTYLVSVECPA